MESAFIITSFIYILSLIKLASSLYGTSIDTLCFWVVASKESPNIKWKWSGTCRKYSDLVSLPKRLIQKCCQISMHKGHLLPHPKFCEKSLNLTKSYSPRTYCFSISSSFLSYHMIIFDDCAYNFVDYSIKLMTQVSCTLPPTIGFHRDSLIQKCHLSFISALILSASDSWGTHHVGSGVYPILGSLFPLLLFHFSCRYVLALSVFDLRRLLIQCKLE